MGAEVALAFLAGAASFALVAVVVTALDSDVLLVVLAAVCIAVVLAIARFCGVAYAIPVALASLLAYDWFQFPPTHPREFPDSANLADLVLYLGVAVFVGELAAYAGRRADVQGSQERGERALTSPHIVHLVNRLYRPSKVAKVDRICGEWCAAPASAEALPRGPVGRQRLRQR